MRLVYRVRTTVVVGLFSISPPSSAAIPAFPADRLDSYRTSAYKDRIDRIGQRLIEQRYRPDVTA